MEDQQYDDQPKWLESLARQSWEAELIMSGLAIYGASALIPVVDKLVEQMVFKFDDRILEILNYAFLYVYVALTLIMMSFIAHFALRLLWVGTLGLSSVYPGGINLQNESYTRSFLQKVKDEFPSLQNFSLKLDRTSSVIFSILCVGVLMMLSISVWIIIYLIVSEILSNFLSDEIITYIGWSLIVLFYIFAIMLALISTGKYKETAFAEKYAYPLSKKLSKTMGFFCYEPATFLNYVLRTNVSTKQFIFGIVVILTISMFFSVGNFERISEQYSPDKYFEMNSRTELAEANNYLDKFNDHYILRPIIQSQEIEEDYLKLFLPKYKRESDFRKTICGELEYPDGMEKKDKRIMRAKYRADCANSCYEIMVDNRDVYNVKFNYRIHSNAGEQGYEAYVPLDSISTGYHELKIVTPYKNEDGVNAIRVIPFYKT